MLTPTEEKYLSTIPASRPVQYFPYDPRVEAVARGLIAELRQKVPCLQILFLGSSALKVGGQNDIDLYVLCDSTRFGLYLLALRELLGGEAGGEPSSVRWVLEREGLPVEVYLTDPNTPEVERQIAVHTILDNKPDLLNEYAALKEEAAPLGYREYQRRKYEFYNDILSKRDLDSYPDKRKVEKVLVYLLSGEGEGRQLLTFSQRDYPKAGRQVPAGSVEPGERAEEAAVREAFEETGVKACAPKLLTSYEHRDSVTRLIHTRHVVRMEADRDRETWEHPVSAGQGDAGLVVECQWVSLHEADLAGTQGNDLSLIF